MEGGASTGSSPGARWRGRIGRRRPDGDELIHGDGGRRRRGTARFGRVTASRHAILDEDKEEVEAELVEASARPAVVGDDGKRGGRS